MARAFLVRAVLPGMVRSGHGRIVNVSTSAGFAAVPMLSAYVVSKAALYRLTENLAAGTRGCGVKVFALSPGLMPDAQRHERGCRTCCRARLAAEVVACLM